MLTECTSSIRLLRLLSATNNYIGNFIKGLPFGSPFKRVDFSTRLQEMLAFLADRVLRTHQGINNPRLEMIKNHSLTLLFVLGEARFRLRIKVCDALSCLNTLLAYAAGLNQNRKK